MNQTLQAALAATPRLMTEQERVELSLQFAAAATTTPLCPEDWVLTSAEQLELSSGKADTALEMKRDRQALLCAALSAVGSVDDSQL